MPRTESDDEVSTDLGSDSQTVMIYPKDDESTNTTNTTSDAPSVEVKSKMVGAGRKI